ncbi:DUF4411 family protein [Schaalia sp. ZJ1691]|uniref:DUF4411 family protein n=1 Tax=Schaalia sp. ZJ1691 TaxID=2709404 RepID=UPI0013EB6C89|nr:DUF4411 family protein [Schaalia sp. ZJ1691]
MFLVDTNVLIEAKNRYYAFDIAPGFWVWLDQAHRNAVACSLEAARDELLEGDDELTDWAKKNASFFRPIDQGTTQHFSALTDWAISRNFTPSALSDFTGTNADYLLIAYAREHQHTVVTHERSKPNARNRVLIPDACLAMGVSTVDTFQMLRHTGAQLDLR